MRGTFGPRIWLAAARRRPPGPGPPAQYPQGAPAGGGGKGGQCAAPSGRASGGPPPAAGRLVRARLHRILNEHGLRNGTAVFLPYDQGLEHGPRDFFANPAVALTTLELGAYITICNDVF